MTTADKVDLVMSSLIIGVLLGGGVIAVVISGYKLAWSKVPVWAILSLVFLGVGSFGIQQWSVAIPNAPKQPKWDDWHSTENQIKAQVEWRASMDQYYAHLSEWERPIVPQWGAVPLAIVGLAMCGLCFSRSMALWAYGKEV